jgi:hypothetical protein
LGGLVLLVGVVCGCEPLDEPTLALNYAVSQVQDGEESVFTSGCQELEEGLGFGFGQFDPSYEVEYLFSSDSVTVTVSSEGRELDRRVFDEDFILGEGVDDALVPITDDLSLHLVNVGSATGCEPSVAGPLPDLDDEELIGGEPDTGGE